MNLARSLRPCGRAALAACLVAASTASIGAAQDSGTIAGVITTRAAAPKPLRVTMDQRVCGNELPDESIVVDGRGRLANAVVTLVGVKSRTTPASGSVNNEKCRFTPRVQIARPNATITTSSKDPILHTTNAAMDGGAGLFNVAVPVPGITISKQVAGPGVVRIVCNTHPWMRGYIVVTEEMAAVTGADGSFTLSGVPPGTYELRVWHETLRGAPQKITVATGQTVTANFDLK